MNPRAMPPHLRLLETVFGIGAASDTSLNTPAVHAWLTAARTGLQTERQAEIVRLHLGLDGERPHTVAEIAAAMGLSRVVVRNREARAMRALRKAWQQRRRAPEPEAGQ